MAKKINIGIIGLGNIGSALVAVLRQNRSVIIANTGVEIVIKKVCDLRKRVVPYPQTKDPYEIINDPEISLVVEAIGGVKPARQYILAALKQGKHVVTPNKEVVAKHLKELLTAAQKHGVQLLFEASVGGGIPIIRPLQESLRANQILEVYGIVNGTTNYILSKMTEEGSEFSEALARAKEKGYAEPNPASDIKGYDAAYKAAILAAVAFNAEINWQEIPCEGIENITQEDIQYARDIGYVIKLLAVAKKNAAGLDVRVHPALVSQAHPLAAVSDNFNAIYIKGEPIGQLMFYGQGAGGGPTASAIISDIIAAANPKSEIRNPKLRKINLKKISEVNDKFYLRLRVLDRYGVLARISRVFAQKKVSIAAVMQKETVGKTATIVIVTDLVAQENLAAALKIIKKVSVVRRLCNVIRIVS